MMIRKKNLASNYKNSIFADDEKVYWNDFSFKERVSPRDPVRQIVSTSKGNTRSKSSGGGRILPLYNTSEPGIS